LILGTLLVVLWVRSYAWRDGVNGRVLSQHRFMTSSLQGRLRFAISRTDDREHFPLNRCYLACGRIPPSGSPPDFGWVQDPSQTLGFHASVSPRWVVLGLPHWFLLLLCGILPALDWFPRPFRFTLRTLLAVTTYVAVVLGLIAVFAR
jgi:hypothetical protein